MKLPVYDNQYPEFDPEEVHVELTCIQCRQCDRQSPWTWDTTHSDPNRNDGMQAAYEWQREHNSHTGHKRFYRWSLTRNTGRLVTL